MKLKTYIFSDKYISGLEFHVDAANEKKAREYLGYRIDEANGIGYSLPNVSQWELEQ